MRIETIPVVLGGVIAICGLALLADAWLPEALPFGSERRRRRRSERSLGGEACVGLSLLCLGAALFGRDSWRYGTAAMLVGASLLLAGIVLNRRYLRDRVLNRGALRRTGTPAPQVPRKSNRIR